MKAAGLLIFAIWAFASLSGFAQAEKPDPFAEAFKRSQAVKAAFLKTLEPEKDPVLRFMICARELVEIQKYLDNPENMGAINSGLGAGEEPPTDPEAVKNLLEEIRLNQEKLRVSSEKIAQREAAVEQMQADIGLMIGPYQKRCSALLRSLGYSSRFEK